MGVGIMAVTGPEGAGKTVYMTAMCVAHVRLGGKLFAFPGYEVFDFDKKGKKITISTPITIEEVVSLDEDKFRNSLWAIDEIQNFFSVYSHASVLTRLFGSGIMAQRRKLSMGIIYTVQDFKQVPNNFRYYTHYLVACWDMYHANRMNDTKYERGTNISINTCDLKGFMTGFFNTWDYPGTIFHAKSYWPHYNSYGVVSFYEQFTKVDVERKKLKVFPYGQDESDPGPSPMEEAMASDVPGDRIAYLHDLNARYEDGLAHNTIKPAQLSKMRRVLDLEGLGGKRRKV